MRAERRRTSAALPGDSVSSHNGFETEIDSEDDSFTVDTDSHPPIDERIARLREVAATLEHGRERLQPSGNERVAVSRR